MYLLCTHTHTQIDLYLFGFVSASAFSHTDGRCERSLGKCLGTYKRLVSYAMGISRSSYEYSKRELACIPEIFILYIQLASMCVRQVILRSAIFGFPFSFHCCLVRSGPATFSISTAGLAPHMTNSMSPPPPTLPTTRAFFYIHEKKNNKNCVGLAAFAYCL